jgi:dienelactone hydrolase
MRYIIVLLLVIGCVSVQAEVQTKVVEYQDGDETLSGFAAWDTAAPQGKLPGVLVVHQWLGLTDYEQSRCKQLASLGYVAFALDIYGKGVRPANMQEAAAKSSEYKSDRAMYRRRLNLGLEQLRKLPSVDAKQLAAIGYCFGGTGVLELARSGAEIAGVVSFHGGLDSPSPADGKNIKAKILVLHGADDPFVPQTDINLFVAELNAAHVDWQMIHYSGTVHSFTQPNAGNDNSRGAAYNRSADLRSWAAMQSFFAELFAKQ